MAGKRHTAAFITGSVIGGVVGAGIALWKTPQSGADLRALLGSASDPNAQQGRLSSPLLGVVETLLAPIVGVELGKTANGSGPRS